MAAYSFEITILCTALGFLAVGFWGGYELGKEHAPRLVVTEYTPQPRDAKGRYIRL